MEKVDKEVKKRVKKPSTDRVVIFRTTRTLRDKLVKKAAQNVIDGKRVGLGAGGTYSVNHAATEMLAEALGVSFKREKDDKDSKSPRVGLSFLFPVEIYDALQQKADREGISINETMRRILEISTS